jgi:hypothetical protein
MAGGPGLEIIRTLGSFLVGYLDRTKSAARCRNPRQDNPADGAL